MIKSFRKLLRLKRYRGSSPRRQEEHDLSQDQVTTSKYSLNVNPAVLDRNQENTEDSHLEPNDSTRSRQKLTDKLQNLLCVTLENPENGTQSSEIRSENSPKNGTQSSEVTSENNLEKGTKSYEVTSENNPEKGTRGSEVTSENNPEKGTNSYEVTSENNPEKRTQGSEVTSENNPENETQGSEGTSENNPEKGTQRSEITSENNQEKGIKISEETAKNPKNETIEVIPDHSESWSDKTQPCTSSAQEGKVNFDELIQVNAKRMYANPQPKDISQIQNWNRRKNVHVQTKSNAKEKNDDKNRLFELAFNVELRRIFIKVPYFFNTFKNELQGKVIGRQVVTKVDEAKLRISIERMIAYMWPIQKQHVIPFVETLPDDCDLNMAVNYFRKQMKKSYGAYLKNFSQMMGLVAYNYFDKDVPLARCLKVYQVDRRNSNMSKPGECEREWEMASQSKDATCSVETDFQTEHQGCGMSANTDTSTIKDEKNHARCPSNSDSVGELGQSGISDIDTGFEQVFLTNSESEIPEEENEKTEITRANKCDYDVKIPTSQKEKNYRNLHEYYTFGKTTLSDAYFEIGQYRLDESIAVGKSKKGSVQQFKSSMKKKIKSRGVPNKHLKNDENLLLDNALEEEYENCEESDAQDNFLTQLQDENRKLQGGDASVSSIDFADFYVIPDEDAEPDMRHKESTSCLVIRGKKGDCDRLEESYKVGVSDRKSNKPRRHQQRKNKKETIFLSYNMNNNASSEDVSDTDSAQIEYANQPLKEDDSFVSEGEYK
ncbi:hypothetical protein FSP39_009204 [Pinctada imbricata]|uniref:Uncharacterized protein n=1 Tax=Pinctada imbricata TaxID=66713 RepID=A0AA88YQI7_PINIB|nr:hypothetical protein FSP39_009204 [Pinctada imbricata]